ncbi:MAG: vitamin B12-dependent ribonucleotide reductase [Candidatus Omnitrophica bacterium]|nr:vitamin B12-dependent ribonucleotide reductase [Candidatus Omnitrophota bacterium]
MQFSSNARLVLNKRYLTKNSKGKVMETPRELVERVAKTMSTVERRYGATRETILSYQQKFFDMIANLEFMPNSPTLMNAGKELGQLSACFVIPVEDSMDSIFDAIKSTALVHKTGGGTGFSFSRLRQSQSMVQSTGGVASGPISFMKVFDAATQAVKQGGTRRGANMGILRIDHPDIIEFIRCKETEGAISNFNISIAITDDFMEKVLNNENYDLIDPHTKEPVKQLNAKEVFDIIAECAYKNGEPGIVFIDKINKDNPTPHLGDVESTNPCGEQPLLPFESCNLGSINLTVMLKDVAGSYEVDWDKLKRVTALATRFLDNVIDANKFPIPQIKENTLRTRKIGLGIMGWATMLGFLGIPYQSQEAIDLAKKIMSVIRETGKDVSIELAKERGVFPSWKGSLWEKQGIKIRNATITTIAPTGTISIIAGPTSSGIEPNFALCYFRNVLDGEKLLEIDPSFEAVARKGKFYSQDLMRRIAEGESIQQMDEIPAEVKKVFKTALEIDPIWHIKMQAAFQEYTDNAVSKTINLPNKAVADDIKEIYMLSYKLGCKGLTIYRDGSRKIQVLTVDKKEEVSSDKPKERQKFPKTRPEIITGTTTKVSTGCGNLYVTVNHDQDGRFFEVFTQMGKAGGCAASQLEAVGRLISLALRGGIEMKVIVEQLKGIRCPSPSWANGKKIFSCADAISRALEKCGSLAVVKTEKIAPPVEPELEVVEASKSLVMAAVTKKRVFSNIVGVCPDCGFALRHQEGCLLCDACGYSKC